jgi:hypothetical protein
VLLGRQCRRRQRFENVIRNQRPPGHSYFHHQAPPSPAHTEAEALRLLGATGTVA